MIRVFDIIAAVFLFATVLWIISYKKINKEDK